MNTDFNYLGAGFFLMYLILMLSIGWFASRRQKTSEDFLVAGRQFGLWTLVLANVAAMLHGGAILSHMALSAQMGGVVATANISYVLGFAMILFFYAKKLRNSKGITLPDYMGERFDSRLLQGWSACIVVFTSILVLVGQIKVMGYLFEALVGLPVFWGQLIGTLIFVAYVSMGGLLAVVWTNIAQFFLMWMGILLIWPIVYQAVGGWSDVLLTVEQVAPGWTSIKGVQWNWGFVLSWYILVFVAYSTRIELVTKLFAARDERVARFSVPWTALLIMLFLVYIGIYLGGAARILVWDQISTPDQAFPALVAMLAGPWLSAFALTAVASATMSTTDSLLLMSGAAVSHDLIRKCIHKKKGIKRPDTYYLKISRITILVIGIFAFLISLTKIGLIWEIISYSLAIVGSAIFFPLTIGLISWRMSREAAIVSSMGGVLVAIIWMILSISGIPWALLVHPVLPGLFASGIGLFSTQCFTGPVSRDALKNYFPELA
jgi:Na+/proline symporter